VSQHPRNILKELEGRARRRFGQNFLVAEGALQQILVCTRLTPESKVLEIGPGLGALTRVLLSSGAQVRAVEIDRDLCAYLEEQLPELDLVCGDALGMDWGEVLEGEGWVVCANLPYNVATPLLTQLVCLHSTFSKLVLMFQFEVAQRLVASPRTSAYGSLSVYVQAWSRPRIAFTLPPSAFFPRPKIQSAVVVLELCEPRLGGCQPRHFEAVVRAGFSQRRKTLENSLSTRFPKPLVRQILAETVGSGRRAEELDLEAWGILARALELALASG
jgi:16S rRNA (adenine1518-N6/adenine1519-N6)-dimethyltransferase